MFVYNGKSNKFFKRPPVPKKGQPKGLRIIIVGCGKVGATLVEQLSREGHDLTIIDKSPQRIQSITGLFDVMGIVGNGASYSVQMEAGIEDADLIIAVTNSDNHHVLSGYPEEKLGLAMIINPELEAAKEAARILYLPTALEVNSFAHGQAELIKFKVPEGNMLDGMTIAFLGKTIAHNILICAVERGKEIFIPSGDFQMKKGDIISFVSSRRSAKDFLETIGFKTNRVKSTMIIGGGKAAYYLAKQLLHMGISVKIIEIDKARCEELSILLPKAVIINGDGTNEDLLKEEGIEYTESFVALTGIDEENILLTLYARQVSNAKVITKINRITFKDVISNLDLGSVIYPRYITSETIIAYVRAKKNSMGSDIETLYHMFDHRAEAIEFRVREKSAVTNISLAELPLKKNLLLSCINRNGKIIIPSGQDCIRVGDTVMIVTTHTGFNDILDILETSR